MVYAAATDRGNVALTYLPLNLCCVRSVKKTDVQKITPLYILVYFNNLPSSHWSQTLPDDNLDLYNHFSGKIIFEFFGVRYIFSDCGSHICMLGVLSFPVVLCPVKSTPNRDASVAEANAPNDPPPPPETLYLLSNVCVA